MARSANDSRPGRALLALVVLIALIFGSVALGVITHQSSAQWTPKLALDLEGGTQLVLSPQPQAGEEGKITPAQITDAVKIMRQRVNGTGVSEAEVTTEGSGARQSIVVSLPGTPDQKTLDLIKSSAELLFRPVLVAAAAAPQPVASTTATPSPSGSPSPSGKASKKASGQATPSATPTGGATPTGNATPQPSSTSRRIVPQALLRAAKTPEPSVASVAASPSAAASAAGDPSATTDPGTAGQNANTAATGTASDLAQITPALEQQFTQETCQNLEQVQAQPQDPTKPIVTCQADGTEKFLLGPVEVRGKNIKTATSGLGSTPQGGSNGQWVVNLTFDSTGAKQFADVTTRLAGLTGAQNQFAIVLDKLVISAPQTNERIPGGQAQISGRFDAQTAEALASQLKFGALPVSFQVDTSSQISALLGGDQLRHGLEAGLIGLILVVLYSLLQYRALGLVTIFSLIIAGILTYGLVVLLGWTQGFRLSLAGVAGLIVAIGITADSFIVYFERVRDEVREGRPLRSAVEAAWLRARRTILVSDTVSFLAAVVLYVLAVGGVRGFAFTLGLTTLIDVAVVFLFTKPTVTLISRTHFFGGGHRLSGFGPEQLGRAAVGYAGRGRIRTPDAEPAGTLSSSSSTPSGAAARSTRPARAEGSIAARRAAAARAAEQGRGDDGAGGGEGDPGGGGPASRVPAGRTDNSRRDA